MSAQPDAPGIGVLPPPGRLLTRGQTAAGAPTEVGPAEVALARAWSLAILAAFLILALGYVALILPFDSPDENSHYEYAVRRAELGRTPALDDRDPALHARVRDYMVANGSGLWLTEPGGARQIGFNLELGRQPPLYYLLPGALARLWPNDFGVQVRLMRLTSVLCGVGVVALGLLAGRIAFPRDPLAALLLPAVAALTPGFLFIAASVNNDNLANLGGALAFLGLVMVGRGRLGARPLLLVAAGLLLGLAGKRTALALLPPACLVLYLAALSRVPSPRLRWAALLAPLLVLPALPLWGSVEVDRAAGWQTARAGQSSRSGEGMLGEAALLVVPEAPDRAGRLLQVLSLADVARSGGAITAAAWARSLDGSTTSARLVVDQGERSAASSVPVDATWRLVRVVYRPEGRVPVRVSLAAGPDGTGALFDGVVIAPGERAGIPQTDAADARRGIWGGRPFANMVANGSAELAERGLRPGLGTLALALGAPPAVLLELASPTLLPPALLLQRLQFTFETYLGRFGWLTLSMPDPVYWLAAALALLGLVGVALGLARRRDLAPLGLCVLGAASAFLVGVGPFLVGAMGDELPQGRYLYPAILPISGLLALGLSHLVPRRHESPALALFLAAGVLVNLLAMTTALIPRYTGAI